MTDIPTLLSDRQQTHGDFPDVADRFCRIVQAVGMDTATADPRHVAAVTMIAMKLARIGSGDAAFDDHWNDIAGYAALVTTEGHIRPQQAA